MKVLQMNPEKVNDPDRDDELLDFMFLGCFGVSEDEDLEDDPDPWLEQPEVRDD